MELTGNTFFFDWEVSLMAFLQSHMGSFGATLASILSTFGEELVMIAILGFIYWCYDKKFGKFIALNIVMVSILNPLLKNIFLRRRPYFDNPQIKCLKPVDKGADIYDIAAQGFSFPSGHSSNAAATYGSLAAYKKKNKAMLAIAIILPLLVGVSRFCVGVHYPTDVICGWLLGLIVIFLVPFLHKKIKNEPLFYLVMLLIGLPGWFYCTTNDFYTGYGMMIGFFAGFLFEERFVKFEVTKKVIPSVLRVLCGGALYFGLNTLLKLPFPTDFLTSGTFLAFLVRTIRYAVVCFVVIGVYPMIFKIFKKKAAKP